MSSRQLLLSLSVIASLAFTSGGAWAQSPRQERLFAAVPRESASASNRIVEIDTAADTFGRVLTSTPVPTLLSTHEWLPVSGGRFLVGSTGFSLDVFDTRLLVIGHLPVTGDLLALDTHRPRVFFSGPPVGFPPFHDQVNILDFASGAISSVATAPYAYKSRAAHASLVDRLFLQRDSTIVDVVNVATGTVVQSIDIAMDLSNPVHAIVADAAGSRLFVVSRPISATTLLPLQLSAFDVATGALIKRVDVQDSDLTNSLLPFHSLRLDEERGRLLVAAVIVLDAATLERLGAASPTFGGQQGPRFAFTGPRSPFIIFSSQSIGGRYPGEPSRCLLAQLEQRNAATGALQAIVDIGTATGLTTTTRRFVGCTTYMSMPTVPRAPQNFVGAVNGRQVTLSWIDPGNTTHFDVEAGSAPGLANILSRAIGGTAMTVDDVPPGHYYVRVRAINDVGRSVPTADVELIVH